jgi:hypothetical protein
MNYPMHPAEAAPALTTPKRADYGRIILTSRDILGLLVVAEHYGVPYDLLAGYLGISEQRVRALTVRWRKAGLVETGNIGPGPAWVWVTPKGMKQTGYTWPADPPALGMLNHHRAALAVRLRMREDIRDDQEPASRRAVWRCERKLREGRPISQPGHIPDAEVTWPATDRSPQGELWAVEAELMPKGMNRTRAIMSGLLAQPYTAILYACTPQAMPGVTAAAETFAPGMTARIVIRSLPRNGLPPRHGA